METTLLLSKILGPVLLLRGISILINRQHFVAALAGLQKEAHSVAFSVFPIILLMASIALAASHSDTSSVAALLLHVIAWLGILKGAVLILRPKVLLDQAQHFGEPVFLHGAWIIAPFLERISLGSGISTDTDSAVRAWRLAWRPGRAPRQSRGIGEGHFDAELLVHQRHARVRGAKTGQRGAFQVAHVCGAQIVAAETEVARARQDGARGVVQQDVPVCLRR